MIGAIVGDIVGSVYEWHNIKTKEFPLFQDRCFFTDDTVMTIAVAEGLMRGGRGRRSNRAGALSGPLRPGTSGGRRAVGQQKNLWSRTASGILFLTLSQK